MILYIVSPLSHGESDLALVVNLVSEAGKTLRVSERVRKGTYHAFNS